MPPLPHVLAIAAALSMTAFACSDDVLIDTSPDTSPDAPPTFEFTEPAPCVVQIWRDYGGCYSVIGAIFDGERCFAVSGCTCVDNDCPAYDSFDACVAACDQPTE